MVLQICLCMILVYLLGSLPTAYLVGHLVKGVDIRQIGDRNVGARNTFREVGALAGVAVALIDVAKGSAAVLIARRIGLQGVWVLVAGAVAVLGHDFMLFLRFRGGQGMATTVGVLLVVLPWQTLMGLCAVGIAFFLARLSSDVSFAIGLGSIPLLAWITRLPLELVLYPIALLPIVGMRKLAQGHASHDEFLIGNDGTTGDWHGSNRQS